jgi:hypothetical protein
VPHEQAIEEWELESMRAATREFYPDHLTIKRPGGSVDDEWGGQTEPTETVLVEDVDCIIEPGAKQEQEQVVAAKIEERELFVVAMPVTIDVQVDDVLYISSQNDMKLTVRAVFSPESYEIERRVIAVR